MLLFDLGISHTAAWLSIVASIAMVKSCITLFIFYSVISTFSNNVFLASPSLLCRVLRQTDPQVSVGRAASGREEEPIHNLIHNFKKNLYWYYILSIAGSPPSSLFFHAQHSQDTFLVILEPGSGHNFGCYFFWEEIRMRNFISVFAFDFDAMQ